MSDEVEPIKEKSEEEVFNIERIRTLQEALRVDYIEKMDVFAKLRMTQKLLTEAQVKLAKYEKVNELISSNNKMLSAELVESKGIAKYEKDRAIALEKKNKDLRAKIKELKDVFVPVEEPYIEPEPEVKPKRKSRAKKVEPEE